MSLGDAQNPGPFLLEPVLAPCGIEMIRYKAGLLNENPKLCSNVHTYWQL